MMNMNVDEHFVLIFLKKNGFAMNRILDMSTSMVEYNSQLNNLL
jgi:hypothetical protein